MLFFINFLTLKIGDDPNNQPSSVIWLLVNHNALELTVQKKANLIIRPHKIDFLFCISCQHLQKSCAFGQFMDILLHLLNLSWPSLFKIEIESNNFTNEETCSGSLHSFSNKCIWLCPVHFIGLSMQTVCVRRQFFL